MSGSGNKPFIPGMGMNPMQNPMMSGIPTMPMGMPMMQGMPTMPMMFNPMMMANNPMNPMNPMNQMNMPQRPVEYKKVWVGHIPPSLSDTFMLKLLETCGAVSSWKRTTDHMGRPKGFGLCEYQTVESMLKSLRLLNNLKLEEGYELSIKVDSKTEEFLKQWREQKKQEWIDGLRRRGIEVNLEEIKKRENNREPLEWELQLINKDNETRKAIFEILTQKNEIEMYAKQNENPEDYMKDLKDLTSSSSFSSHLESERERERARKKVDKAKKIEKQYKDEEKRWERHEEDKERERMREIHAEEDLKRRKKRLIEKDLNYDSEEEKRKMRQNPKKYEDYRIMREKEKESDAEFRKKENPPEQEYDVEMNDHVTELALKNAENEIRLKEPEAKTQVIFTEYHEDDAQEGEEGAKTEGLGLSLNLETKKGITTKPTMFIDEDYDAYDPYHKKNITLFEINPETEKEILEMKKEVLTYAPEPEAEKESKKETSPAATSTPPTSTLPVSLSSSKLLEMHKQIYESIPKNNDDLLKFPINWNIVYKYNILENKIKTWLGKKLVEYLGEDEPELKTMIIKKLANKINPYELMEKIRSVFDEDTEDFITKLWRNFIFEMLKAQKMQTLQLDQQSSPKTSV